MDFTSQICTTKIQSERLLALGLKKETADIIIRPDNTLIVINENSFIYHNLENAIQVGYSPAWSLHRLIEIAQLPQSWQCLSGDWYSEVIAHIQSMIHINQLNKEYLEE